MKKIHKGILAFFCAATMALGFVGCGAESAYDIAVKNGFVGDEKAWLQSLRGENGEDAEDITAYDLYETAKSEAGYQGSYLDFCKDLDIDASDNNDTRQIAENMMSVVGVYCGFSQTTGRYPSKNTEYSTSMGSGVIVDLNKEAGNAIVITNYHVIYNGDSDAENGICDNIYLYLYGAVNRFDPQNGDVQGNGMQARFIGGAMDYDVALLVVEGNEYLQNSAATEAKIGNSDELKEGEKVFAIGNPEGAGISVNSGVVSVKSEYISIGALDNRDDDKDGYVDEVSYRVIRTDAAINGGNSGGALFNARGELVGITNAKNVGEEMDNMGYALPIGQVVAVCDNIQDNDGVVKRAMLGVMVSVEDGVATIEGDGLTLTEKVTVAERAHMGSAAYKKLIEGDVFEWIQVVKADGTTGERVTIDRQYKLNDALLTVRKGDKVKMGISRDGSEMEVEIAYSKYA